MIATIRKHWHGWSLRRRSLASLIIPLLVATIVLLVMAKVLAFNRHAEDELQRGLRVLGQIHAAHAALAEAASGVRGYLLTQDEAFLAPYQRAEELLKQSLRQLEVDVKDSVQRQNLADISTLIAVKLANLAQLKNPDLAVNGGSIRSYSLENKALLDRLRQHIKEMEIRENQIILALQQDLQRARRSSQWIIFSTLVVAVALAVLFSQGFARDLIIRIRRIRDNATNIGRGIPWKERQSEYQDELAELDKLVVQTGFMQDKRLEELRYAKSLAENANQAKTDFLSRTSHELRTPLNAIIGFSDLLGNNKLTRDQLQHVGVIRRSASHLLELVNDLLTLSQLENGNISTEITPVSLKEIVTTAVDFVSQAARAKAVKLNISDDDKSYVLADPKCLLQILINLLDNAIKFTPKKTTVTVNWRPLGSSGRENYEIVVHDCGPGITPGFEKDLFCPFNRLDSKTDGIGLGLAISRSLATNMSGHIEHRATKGGCEFVLRLPAADGSSRGRGSDSYGPPDRESKLLKEESYPETTWVLAIESPDLPILFETLAARFHAKVIHVSDPCWPELLPDTHVVLITDIPAARLDLPPSLRSGKQLHITPEPPPSDQNNDIRWLAPPATPMRIRLLLKEMH